MQSKKMLFVLYVACIHIVIIVILLKSDFRVRLYQRMGLTHLLPEITQHYNNMLPFHLRIDGNVPEGAVLFIGDSITQGLCVSAVTDKGVNLGIGYDTTFGVLKRVALYASVNKARSVMLAVGINDIITYKKTDDEIIKNYKKIILSFPENLLIIISAILPIDEHIKGVTVNKKIVNINKRLVDLCASTKNCNFVDSGKKMIGPDGNLKADYHIGDGIHLNATGYEIWIEDLKAVLINHYY